MANETLRTLRTQRRTLMFIAVFALAICAVLSASTSAYAAQTKPTQQIPDVMIMVMSGLGTADGVSFTYNAPVSEAAVKNDFRTLLQLTGWKPADIRATSQGSPKTTSVEFYTKGIVNWTGGSFPVEPFAVTFKRYNFVQVQYILQGTFPFHALRNYSNKYVDITWQPSKDNAAHGYSIKIKNHNFDRLGLPLTMDASDDANHANVKKKSGHGASVLLLFLIAALVGVVVFVVASRATQNRKE